MKTRKDTRKSRKNQRGGDLWGFMKNLFGPIGAQTEEEEMTQSVTNTPKAVINTTIPRKNNLSFGPQPMTASAPMPPSMPPSMGPSTPPSFGGKRKYKKRSTKKRSTKRRH